MNGELQLLPTAMPPFLQRPDDRGALAELTLVVSENAEGGFDTARWMLRGAPDVVLMAEKLFSNSRSSKINNAISWPVVSSMFEDLLMLQHRFPIAIGPSAALIWNDQYQSILASWKARLSTSAMGHAKSEGDFRGTLQPFQESGLLFLCAHRKSLLADDMGLGKTPMALAFLDRIKEWPAVIVCQPHVMRHWERKIEQFLSIERAGSPMLRAGGLTWTLLRGQKADHAHPNADIYLIHYLIVGGWEGFLKARGLRTVIFDEAQELRRSGTRKHEANRALARTAKNIVGLSGTPIYNKGSEIYNVMSTLNRGCLGTRADFIRQWCSPLDLDAVEAPDALGKYLSDRGLMLRRRKEDVLTELPGKRRVIEHVDADNKKFAELLKEAVRLASDAAFVKDPFDRAKMEAEAIAHTRLATGVAKAPGVIAFLQALMEAGQPTLVFSHHHAVHDMIADALDAFEPARITGKESMSQKDHSQNRFQEGETNLCLIALRAATGLDGLQARARVVVFAEFDWSPAVHRQAEDRAHRMGQKDSVLAYYLSTDLGTDPGMLATLRLKESQFVGLMQDHKETEEDHVLAQVAAEQHKDDLLRMLKTIK